ncbi:hypothetical protein COLO4_07986 [Corchorus olitorius]|uniref:Protein kinase domain-containing protein n=1 Tax=Corchorus olitorius TaxID=93759 RepID=A0A1R3KHW8_9ROSI|nr:hypothetical protein COLO4_07986 [Corchorus olitorius]
MKFHLFSLLCFSNVFRKKSPQCGRNVSPALSEGICREFSLAEIKASTNSSLWPKKFSLLCFSNVFRKKSPQCGRNVSPALPENICREFSLAEIKASTKNFHRDLIIGRGGFGKVFKGRVDDGTIGVAVKRYDNGSSQQGFEEFRTEVQLLCQLRHPHLVYLVGFCVDQTALILVYEYVSRDSLHHHLHGKDFVPLDWERRLQICIGADRGLHYLHSGAKRVVVHRDIKSANILLDDEWCLLCGRPPIDTHKERDEVNLAAWACKCIENGTIYNIIDPHLKGRIAPDCFKQFVDIAFGCLRGRKDERPSMDEVEMNLELALELQNKADSEIEHINPLGGCVYEDEGGFVAKLQRILCVMFNAVLENLKLVVSKEKHWRYASITTELIEIITERQNYMMVSTFDL